MDCIHHQASHTSLAGLPGNKIWNTLLHSAVCVYASVFVSLEGGVSVQKECSCGRSRECSSMPEGCAKVRSVTHEKGRWVPRLLLGANPFFNLPSRITNITSACTNTDKPTFISHLRRGAGTRCREEMSQNKVGPNPEKGKVSVTVAARFIRIRTQRDP